MEVVLPDQLERLVDRGGERHRRLLLLEDMAQQLPRVRLVVDAEDPQPAEDAGGDRTIGAFSLATRNLDGLRSGRDGLRLA